MTLTHVEQFDHLVVNCQCARDSFVLVVINLSWIEFGPQKQRNNYFPQLLHGPTAKISHAQLAYNHYIDQRYHINTILGMLVLLVTEAVQWG